MPRALGAAAAAAQRGGRDVAALFREIGDFVRCSAMACEQGWATWLLAVLTGLAFGGAVAAVTAAVSQRPVAAPFVGSYWLTRVASVRWLGGMYLVAFTVALRQNRALIGDQGILPARLLLERADAAVELRMRQRFPQGGGSSWPLAFHRALARVELLPTLLWLARDRRRLDRWLDGIAAAGAALASAALLRGGASVWHLLALWALYHSINAVGQRWYSFGWEALLLETGALSMLAAPAGLLTCACPGAALPSGAAPPTVAVWAFRWLAFRVMLGAGLIKLRGDRAWLDLTAMCHHLETQPIPNPLTRYFHAMPRAVLLFATAMNHVIELLAPWLALVPWRPAQAASGATVAVFQAGLVATGNLSFLNWLTILPGLWSLDDAMLIGLLPPEAARWTAASVADAVEQGQRAAAAAPQLTAVATVLSTVRDVAVVASIVWLSIPVVRNMLGPRGGGKQKMNSSFERQITLPGGMQSPKRRRLEKPQDSPAGGGDDSAEPEPEPIKFDLRALRLLNTYGAFGSVNRERIEIVFEGRRAASGEWLPYTFKAAVDDPMKRPIWLSPYHLRLDWCRWLAACRGRRASGLEEKWVLAFVAKLLVGDPGVRSLLAKDGDPFEGGPNPGHVRGELYLYRFAPAPRSRQDPYWVRERVGQYLPPLGLSDVVSRLSEMGLEVM